MRKHAFGIIVGGLGLLTSVDAQASTIAAGFNANPVGPCDDCFVQSALPFSINFYGQTYSDVFVSNNGYVTFGAGQSTYTPFGLGASYTGNPIIAAFFADVDTRGAGSGVAAYGTGTYNGHSAFGVTWPSVGYYSDETDKLNTFQEILASRSDIGAGDFDVYFNYGQVKWETGDVSGGTDGLGGTSAAVGFSNGTGNPGTYYQLPGSLVPGSFLDGSPTSLVTGTNDGTPGQLLFQIRNGSVVIPGVPEPATWIMMVLGFGGVGFALRRQRGHLKKMPVNA